MKDFKFNLGDEVLDSITEFCGIVTCTSQWLNGCNTYGVQSKVLKDGVPQGLVYFDEPQLVSVKEKVFTPVQETGGSCKVIPNPNRF